MTEYAEVYRKEVKDAVLEQVEREMNGLEQDAGDLYSDASLADHLQ